MDDPTTNPVAAERRNAVVDALTGREPPGLASEAVTAAYAEQEPAPDVPWLDARLFQLRDVLAVTEERAAVPVEVLRSSSGADSLRDAAQELARVVRSLDEQLSAGADLPVDWRPREDMAEAALLSDRDDDANQESAWRPSGHETTFPCQVHVRVTYRDGTDTYYPVPADEGWTINTVRREVVIGKGLGRIHVPLDVVWSYSPEECHPVRGHRVTEHDAGPTARGDR